jgi:hypothetical protein
LLDGLEQPEEALLLLVAGQNTTAAHLAKELPISDRMAAVQVELVEEEVKLAVGHFESQSTNGRNEFVLRELPAAVLVELFKVGHERDVVVIDEGHQASENILESSVVGVGGLEPAFGDLELQKSVEVVVSEVFDDLILEMKLPVDVLHLVDLQA